jgi:anti-sigma regulatory factor (Ser/Thr protein kinase)
VGIRSVALADPGGVDITELHPAPNRAYRHEALLWRDADDFLATAVPFLRNGMAAGEAAMVAVVDERARWLREALGADADDILFVDIAELGRNPARIIPLWRGFLDEHSAHGDAVRGLGEPIWAGRRPEEIAEGQLHEALLNVAVEPDTPFWLVCPYEIGRLGDEVIEEVYRSHPAVIDDKQYRGSHLYGGRDYLDTVFSSTLPALPDTFEELAYARKELHSVSSFVAIKAYAAGLRADRAADLAVAAQELAANSLQRGAATGTLRFWSLDDAVVCEVRDAVAVSDPMTGRKHSPKERRQGLWVANQLCDLVQLRSSAAGTTVRVHQWR